MTSIGRRRCRSRVCPHRSRTSAPFPLSRSTGRWCDRRRGCTQELGRQLARLLRPRRERPRRSRAAAERDEVTPFPLTEMHPIPSRAGSTSQDIGLQRNSQRVSEAMPRSAPQTPAFALFRAVGPALGKPSSRFPDASLAGMPGSGHHDSSDSVGTFREACRSNALSAEQIDKRRSPAAIRNKGHVGSRHHLE